MSDPAALRGNLSELSTCEVLALLCREEATGVLTLKVSGAAKSVYLQKGKIVFASSRDNDDRLGELLLTRGVITREKLEQASAQVQAGKRLGTVLVELGFLPASELPRWVREQVKEIVFSLFSWGEGEYCFEPGPLPSGEVITLKISTAEIFLTGLRRVQKWSILRKGAGEIQIPYRLVPNFRHSLKDVQLAKEDESLIRLMESGSYTMEQAARESTLTTLFVYQIFFALRVLGVLIPDKAGPETKPALPEEPSPQPAAKDTAPRAGPPGTPSPVEKPGDAPAPSPLPAAPAASRAPVTPEMLPLGPLKEIPVPPPEPATRGDAGARTVMLKISPPAPLPVAPAEAAVPAQTPPRKKKEYKIVRVEGEKLDGNGTSQIEELLGSWSRKGYSLAGVVPGKGSSIFSSAPPSFFIFVRD